jgi:ubiquinone/menaquinone biosynthesis C-methylase UbiE
MNYLEDLVEPISKKALSYDAEKQLLVGEDEYKVINDIPSFLKNEDFGEHWENNATESIPESKLDEANKFLQPVFKFQEKQNRSLKILDGGCGDGIHLLELEKNYFVKQHNSIAYGIDMAGYALQLCKKRMKNAWPLLQCDVGHLPFKNETFDVAFSFGVLGYTNNPFASFEEIIRTVKPGGLVGLWLYPKQTGLGGLAFETVRTLSQLTGKIGTNLLANIIVPFLGLLPIASKMSLANASWKECKEIVMVNIAPTQLFFPTEEEIIDWFKKKNIDIKLRDEVNKITIWGIKK